MFRLIRIDNAKSELLPESDATNYIKQQKEKKVKMISIIGDARTGKSSFLNLMISKISGQNLKIFDTGDSLNDHCTFGISIYHCGDYLFLDCQGLNYQHNIHDTKMMLIAYMLSNVFILNVNMINNIALKLLEPILLFGKFFNFDNIDQDKKPILAFRIKDYSFDDDPVIALEQTMTIRNDNYDHIRNMIKILFCENIIATQTEPLSRKYLNTIKQGEYLNIINDLDTFASCIDDILNINCQMSILNNDFADYIKNLCDTISLIESSENTNKIDEVDEIYKSYKYPQKGFPDGSHDYYVNTICKQTRLYESIVEKIKTQFANSTSLNTYLDEIKNRYESHHVEATKTNYKLACEFTESIFIKFWDNMIEYIHVLYDEDSKLLLNMINQRMQCLECCKKENNYKTDYGILFDFDNEIEYKNNYGCKEHYDDLIQKYNKIKNDINDMEKNFLNTIQVYDDNVVADYAYIIKRTKAYISGSINSLIDIYYEKITEFAEKLTIHANSIFRYIDEIISSYDMEKHNVYVRQSIYQYTGFTPYPAKITPGDSELCIRMIKDIYENGIKLTVSYNEQIFIQSANICLREYIKEYSKNVFHQPLFHIKWKSRSINKNDIKKTDMEYYNEYYNDNLDYNRFDVVNCDFTTAAFCKNIQSIFCSRLLESTEEDKKDFIYAFGNVLFGYKSNDKVSFRQKYADMMNRNVKYISEWFNKGGISGLVSYIKSGNNAYIKFMRIIFQVDGPISIRLYPNLHNFYKQHEKQLNGVYAMSEWTDAYNRIILANFPMLKMNIFDKFISDEKLSNNYYDGDITLPTMHFVINDKSNCDNEIFRLAKYMENVLFEKYVNDIIQ